jgi:hypothetical protein
MVAALTADSAMPPMAAALAPISSSLRVRLAQHGWEWIASVACSVISKYLLVAESH